MSTKTIGEDVYTAQSPHIMSDPDVRQFLTKYHAVANDSGNDEAYGQLFTPDAVSILASRKVVGRPDVVAVRKKLWGEKPKRDHTGKESFSYGNHDDDTELIALNSGDLTHHAGHTTAGD